jgi:hypothetical protein
VGLTDENIEGRKSRETVPLSFAQNVHIKMVNVYVMSSIKGTVARDIRPLVFFHRSTPPRALTHGLKPFRIWLRIRRDNRFDSRENRFQRCQ